jgi:GNAT superfamily N-acetyltransferase
MMVPSTSPEEDQMTRSHGPVSRSNFSDTVLVRTARAAAAQAAAAAGRPVPGTPEYDAYWTPERIASAASFDGSLPDTVSQPTGPGRHGYNAAGMPAPATNPASDKQTDLITRLLGEKDLSGSKFEGHTVCPAGLTGGRNGTASAAITALFALPRKTAAAPAATATPDVPAGRYAVEHEGTLKFYKVDRPTEGRWAGYTFVKVLASSDEHRVSRETAAYVLATVAVDPEAASRRYGREIGSCGRCGRTLTDANSRAEGIGPDCATKGF